LILRRIAVNCIQYAIRRPVNRPKVIVKDGKIARYRVDLMVAFPLEE